MKELKLVRDNMRNQIKQITTPTIPSHLNHFGYIHDQNNFYILELEQADASTVISVNFCLILKLGPGAYDPKETLSKKRTIGGFLPKGEQ